MTSHVGLGFSHLSFCELSDTRSVIFPPKRRILSQSVKRKQYYNTAGIAYHSCVISLVLCLYMLHSSHVFIILPAFFMYSHTLRSCFFISILSAAQVSVFGSCATHFQTVSSDIDLFLEIDRYGKLADPIRFLAVLAGRLRRQNSWPVAVTAILHCRIPIVRVIDHARYVSFSCSLLFSLSDSLFASALAYCCFVFAFLARFEFVPSRMFLARCLAFVLAVGVFNAAVSVATVSSIFLLCVTIAWLCIIHVLAFTLFGK